MDGEIITRAAISFVINYYSAVGGGICLLFVIAVVFFFLTDLS